MKTITFYDPPMCCSTGVCGPEVDPVLPRVAGMLAQIGAQGVVIERYPDQAERAAWVKRAREHAAD